MFRIAAMTIITVLVALGSVLALMRASAPPTADGLDRGPVFEGSAANAAPALAQAAAGGADCPCQGVCGMAEAAAEAARSGRASQTDH